jgi:hypothetical protein
VAERSVNNETLTHSRGALSRQFAVSPTSVLPKHLLFCQEQFMYQPDDIDDNRNTQQTLFDTFVSNEELLISKEKYLTQGQPDLSPTRKIKPNVVVLKGHKINFVTRSNWWRPSNADTP